MWPRRPTSSRAAASRLVSSADTGGRPGPPTGASASVLRDALIMPVCDDALPPHGVSVSVDLSQSLGLIRRGAAGIDLLWNELRVTDGMAGLAVALAEASHAVHRALIALDDPAWAEVT